MESVGTRRLRTTLAEHVRRAGQGEVFTVTIDGRPVAKLGPLDDPRSAPTSMDDLARRGLVVRPAAITFVSTDDPEPSVNQAVAPIPVDVRVDRVLRLVRG